MRQAAAPTVLLVEDEVLISHLVAASLSEHGFNVHETTTADEALRYMHAGGDVDVLFTDVNLPGSMDGAELALRARELRPDLPIVYASGRYQPTDIGGLVPRSVFVSKPYDPDDVGMLLIRLTERSH
ncbi:MAG: response regulator [Betaproteobacteria bacterium]|nr:response regulator [Betaproteobacteria bacterium]